MKNRCTPQHRFGLYYYISVPVSLGAARILLKRLKNENLYLNTQLTHVSGHPGALSILQKLKIRQN